IGAAILKVDTRGDVRAQIEHNIRAIVAVLLDDRALTHILMSYAPGLDAAFMAKTSSFYEGATRLLEEALVEGQGLGIVAAGDPKLFAAFTIGALKEILFQNAIAQQAPLHREELVSSLFTFLEGGFLRVKVVPTDARVTEEEAGRRSKKERR